MSLVVGLALAQLVQIDRSNPPVDGDISTPPKIKAALRAACYDCHSNETVWPWYSHVAPISWLLAHDVSEGRDELNFSTWQRYDKRRQQKKLEEIVETLNEGEMPPWYYSMLHADARLADPNHEVVAWASAEAARSSATATTD